MDGAKARIGPIAGVLAVVGGFIGAVSSGESDVEPSDSAAAILESYADRSDDIMAAVFISGLALGLLIIYAAHLRTRLREHGAGFTADAFLGGAVALVAAMMALMAAEIMGAEAGDQGHTEVAQAAIDVNWNGVMLFTPGLLAMGLALAAASLMYRALPKWLGVFAVIVAVGALMPWIGVGVFFLWVLAASIHELVRPPRSETTDAPPPEIPSAPV